MENDSVDFAKRKGKSDEWFTPIDAILPILNYIKPDSIIWCPFDIAESNFVKIFEDKGYKVICSHINNRRDFFKYEPERYDIIISNPPYSLRNDVLKRLFGLDKPFAMLMNTNGLFDSRVRWELFKNNNFTLIYLSGRVNYMKEYGLVEKSSPPFQSAYICSGLSDKQVIFEERVKTTQIADGGKDEL